jgi:hypothetical protein
VNLLNGTNGNLGWKVEIQGKLSPKNVWRVVTSGWDFSQTYSQHRWAGNTNSFTAITNEPDVDFSLHDAGWKDLLPDGIDRVFALDAPGYLENPPTPFLKRESNFSVFLKWDGVDCSAPTPWWVSQKVETTSGTPNVILNDGGNGHIDLDEHY